MDFSPFGRFLSCGSGILTLMEDIESAAADSAEMRLLGGGNPARIPEVQARFRQAMIDLLEDGEQFERTTGEYDGARGHARLINGLAALLKSRCGWEVGPENIAVTNGSQSSFYLLFKLFAGDFGQGKHRRILLPLAPEYIGYADIGMGDEFFHAYRPSISFVGDREFKYHVDFDRLKISGDMGAIAVSRPTNPTGNVLTDEEVQKLGELARHHGIPFILDSAYGGPFPNIVFPPASNLWDDNTIVCLSLSKLGLPGLRTGIIVANEQVIRAITAANAIVSLAPGSMGPALVSAMVENGNILNLSDNVIRPYYRDKVQQAVGWITDAMGNLPCRVHTPEGAIFLWLWFEGRPITSETLYQRLKQRGVLVIAGEHFFPGMRDSWTHRHECIRISYAQDTETVQSGIAIIGEEVARAYHEGATGGS